MSTTISNTEVELYTDIRTYNWCRLSRFHGLLFGWYTGQVLVTGVSVQAATTLGLTDVDLSTVTNDRRFLA